MIDAYCGGDVQAIKAVKELSWEEYWMWLESQFKKHLKAKK